MRDPSGVTDVFRQEWPRLVATLVKDVGDLEIAEESVQDAFVEAATRWERSGRPDRPGAWYPATLLADVRPGMAAYAEELFGPVAAIVRVEGP